MLQWVKAIAWSVGRPYRAPGPHRPTPRPVVGAPAGYGLNGACLTDRHHTLRLLQPFQMSAGGEHCSGKTCGAVSGSPSG